MNNNVMGICKGSVRPILTHTHMHTHTHTHTKTTNKIDIFGSIPLGFEVPAFETVPEMS